jgi:hypothetical protein
MAVIALGLFFLSTTFLHSCFKSPSWPENEWTQASQEASRGERRISQTDTRRFKNPDIDYQTAH